MNNQITINLTVVSPPHGRGPSDQKKFKIYFGRNDKQLIKSDNNNKLCLFYALELARVYHDKKILSTQKKRRMPVSKDLITKQSFSRILKNDLRKNDLAFKLLNEIGIESNMDSYGIDILPIIQDFYDKRYPGLILVSEYFGNLMLNVKDCIELSLSTSLQKLFGKALWKENIIFHCYTTITILMG